MKYLITFLIFLLIPLVSADTTFFDDPSEVFIMGNSLTSEVTGGITGGATGGTGCLYKWNCTNWGECLSSGKQIRNCSNIGNCPDRYKSPETEQNCNYITPGLGGDNELGTEEETQDKNLMFFYLIIAIILGFIIFYLKKDYLKKLIKK